MIYDDNTIAQQSTSNISSIPNKWTNLSVRRNHRNLQNITINNSDGETAPLCLEKKTLFIAII